MCFTYFVCALLIPVVHLASCTLQASKLLFHHLVILLFLFLFRYSAIFHWNGDRQVAPVVAWQSSVGFVGSTLVWCGMLGS
jgi:hypothetical protein